MRSPGSGAKARHWRRAVGSLFATAALIVALPTLRATAEENPAIPSVAFVRSGTPGNDAYREAFLQGMRERGYVEGQNVRYEFRYFGDDVTALPSLMADVVRLRPSVIVTGAGIPAARAAQAATAT